MNRSFREAAVLGTVALLAAGAWASDAVAGSGTQGKSKGTSYGYTTGDSPEERFSYAIASPEGKKGALTVNGSTSSGDWKALSRLMERDPREVFYVRLDDRPYATHDADAIAEARAILAPMTRLGEKQSRLGERQAELGRRQAELGEQQAALGERQARLGERLADIHEELGDDPSDAEYRSFSRTQREIQQEMADLGRQMEALGRQQAVLGASQGALGREQGALGRQQGVEGQKAEALMRRHAQELLSEGLLEPLD